MSGIWIMEWMLAAVNILIPDYSGIQFMRMGPNLEWSIFNPCFENWTGSRATRWLLCLKGSVPFDTGPEFETWLKFRTRNDGHDSIEWFTM